MTAVKPIEHSEIPAGARLVSITLEVSFADVAGWKMV